MFHLRLGDLRHNFGYVLRILRETLLTWGLAGPSIVASPCIFSNDREAIKGGGRSWRYKEIFVNGVERHWLLEEEATHSFTLLQLEVFHVLRETDEGAQCRPRPKAASTLKNANRRIKNKL